MFELVGMRTLLGESLRKSREHRGYTRDQLAALAGISSGQLYNVEAGKSLPTLPTLRDIATLLGIEAATVGALVLGAEGVSPAKNRQRFIEREGRIVDSLAAAG